MRSQQQMSKYLMYWVNPDLPAVGRRADAPLVPIQRHVGSGTPFSPLQLQVVQNPSEARMANSRREDAG